LEAKGRNSTRYLDWTHAQSALLPNLKPSTKTLPLQPSQPLLDATKAVANALEALYQSVVQMWLQEKVGQ